MSHVHVTRLVGNLPYAVRSCSISHHIRQQAVAHAPVLAQYIVPPLPRALFEELCATGESALPTLVAIVVVSVPLSAVMVTRRELLPHKLAKE